MRERYLNFVAFLALAFCLLIPSAAWAQSVVSGEVDGTVTDATGAVTPNASINLVSSESGFNETTTTGTAGTFRFALVKPGDYTLTVTLSGFAAAKRTVVVSLGQVTNVSVQLEVGKTTQTVEVTAESPLVHTENANLSTSVDAKTIELIPSPGQDITNYAMTTPGITVSTGGGYGNFTANGLPGTSNLYTVNGNDYNDPYLNLNNSGASNLLLGANELQEITVVTNGYTGEYGRAAGANVNYTTKSGSNSFHGNATWFYNGNVMNANDFFNNASGTPRPHEVSNQWAGSFGGPIKKDKLFFFYDNEGLRYVLPGGGQTFVPTTTYANAVVANLNTVSPSSVNFYDKIFGLYAGAPGVNRAAPVAVGTTANANPNGDNGGCGDFTATAVAGQANTFWGDGPRNSTTGAPIGAWTALPCAQVFQSTVNNLNTERLMSVTVDWNASANDTVRWRYKQDRGVQATGTDPINSAFNANSVQPEDDAQVLWTHILSPHTTNQFIVAGLYYSAIFGPPDLTKALGTFPTTIAFGDGVFNNMGGSDNAYPQGRNVTQWQIVDDFSWTHGNHGIKFGVNLRRNDISSFALGGTTSGLITENSMTEFFNDAISAGTYSQSFPNVKEEPVAYYSLGLYLQDEWRVNSTLKLTLALRADRNSNEVCQKNCFARPAGTFLQMDHNINTPYSTSILTGLHSAFPGLQSVAWGPRVGFAWNPKRDLVVRGGFGIFSDLYQGLIADRFITNLPNDPSFTVTGASISPDAASNVYKEAAASNGAFKSGFASGGTFASISAAVAAAGSSFSAPNLNTIVNNITNPHYYEWNLQVEKSFGVSTALSVNYVGNHGTNEFIRNLLLNTYCTPGRSVCPAGTSFGPLPSTAPDGRFGTLTELQNNGISNYDGVTATIIRRFSHGLQGTLNYTYSHSLDDLSNGGLEPYNATNAANSFRVLFDPTNMHLNYANSDYNFPHSLSANYFWELPLKSSKRFLNQAIGGWAISGTYFYKSGAPFSVYNTRARSLLGNSTGDSVLADFLGGRTTCVAPDGPCLAVSQFGNASTQHDFGNVTRNHFVGPSYFNSDFGLQKGFRLMENGMAFTLGADAYNVFNHPNFDNPHASVTSGSLFGQFFQTVTPPNSPYGNFQGAFVSGRVLQAYLKFKF